MDRSRTALLTIVLLAGVTAFVSSLTARESEVVQRELAFGFALRVVGGLVSVVGVAGVLGQWYSGAGAARLTPGGMLVLTGLAVASQSWAAALGLASVLVAGIVWPRGQAQDAGPVASPDSARV